MSSARSAGLRFLLPDVMFALPATQRQSRCRLKGTLACLDDRRFFLRGSLALPVFGQAHPYHLHIWVELGLRITGDLTAFYPQTPDHSLTLPMTAWLANRVPLHPANTLNLPVRIDIRASGIRPAFSLLSCTHPLFFEQSEGITTSRVREYSQWCLAAQRRTAFAEQNLCAAR